MTKYNKNKKHFTKMKRTSLFVPKIWIPQINIICAKQGKSKQDGIREAIQKYFFSEIEKPIKQLPPLKNIGVEKEKLTLIVPEIWVPQIKMICIKENVLMADELRRAIQQHFKL